MSWWDVDLIWPLVVLSQVSGVALVSVLTYWIVVYIPTTFSWEGSGLYGYHAYLSTIGMVFFVGEGMLLFKVPKRLNLKSHLIRKVLHGVTMSAGVILAIVQYKAIVYLKISTHHDEYESVHSWLGMAATMLFFFQYGVAMFFYILSKFFNPRFMIRFTDLHRFFGYVVFALSIASCASGMDRWRRSATRGKEWVGLPTPTAVGNSYVLLMLLFGTVVAFIVSRPPPKPSKKKTTTNAYAEIENGKASKDLMAMDDVQE